MALNTGGTSSVACAVMCLNSRYTLITHALAYQIILSKRGHFGFHTVNDASHPDYGSAFRSMRLNRIDLNLLYDHNPEQFLQHAEHFVRQVDDAENINLFLSDLRDEDTTVQQFPFYRAMTVPSGQPIAHRPMGGAGVTSGGETLLAKMARLHASADAADDVDSAQGDQYQDTAPAADHKEDEPNLPRHKFETKGRRKW